MNSERRQTPRTTVNRLAYINLESNNGKAVVLNVSDGGLCFYSGDPVRSERDDSFLVSGPQSLESKLAANQQGM